MPRRFLTLVPLLVAAPLAGQQAIDSAYTARIRELTPTDSVWKFSTEFVDYLPASSLVPTPLAVLGYVPGTVGRLSYVADINRYFKAVADASPRAQLFSLGMSDEGREMILLAIADEETVSRLDEYRTMLARLADPRGLDAAERARLVRTAKPVYWLTGSIHSPETGSPEMLMELAYRLAVDESPYAREIRGGVITLITPVLEVDGRDRVVDVYKQSKALKLPRGGVNLAYWGKYTAHDNNRDGMVLSQKLTQNYIRGFLHWRPVVGHDLHESVPFLYASTGTGPYNDEFDPIVVDEWHKLAYEEINELTRRGLPGVWTHGFYDGWAPNYVLAIANLHNSIGRFYETYTSSGADCHTVNLRSSQTDREWYRPNPPVNGVRWCIRSNINYQESGVIVALHYVARNAETFLDNYTAKAERMVRRGQTTAPYAFVVPRGQRRAAEAADLVNLFRMQGAEVHVADGDFTLVRDPKAVRDTTAKNRLAVKRGDWIVRMDQPYTATVRTLLAIQKYDADDPQPYDDTGWTLDALRHVETVTVADSSVLSQPMTLLAADASVTGTVAGSGTTYLVPHVGDYRSAMLPWKVGDARVAVADSAFTVADREFPAGTFIVTGRGARDAITALGLDATAVSAAPAVTAHAVILPRVALMHTWRETQNEGWVRYAFDRLGVPYAYISDQDLRRPGALDRLDVVVFPHTGARGGSLLNGAPMVGPPIPWKTTPETPNLGRIDQTDDMRPGMGLEGATALRGFVERGGLLLVEGATAPFPLNLDFTPTVRVTEARSLRTRGAVFRAQGVGGGSPILYGYESRTFPVYFNQAPLLTVQERDTSVSAREREADMDPAVVAELERQRARVIVQFHERQDSLLVSGLLVGGSELTKKAAVIDAPLGRGHVVYFAIRPFWRWQTQGSFALALNAMVNWNALDSAVPAGAAVSADAAGNAGREGSERQGRE
jgi:hypothetical protein